MLVSIIGSLKENFTKKVRNPFFGTLTVVFVLKNWQLFYSLLFFDSYEVRTTRIEVIENYIEAAGGAWMFARAVAWTFGVLVISYILQGLGAFISNVYDSRLHPWIISIATNGANIVTKEKYDLLEKRCNDLEGKFEDERKRRHDTENELEKVNRDYAEYRAKSKTASKTVTKEVPKTVDKQEQSHEAKIVDRITQEYNIDDFKNIIISTSNEEPILIGSSHQQNLIRYLISQDVISQDAVGDYGNPIYIFTTFGEKVRKLFALRTA